jgi:hypothetical protein
MVCDQLEGFKHVFEGNEMGFIQIGFKVVNQLSVGLSNCYGHDDDDGYLWGFRNNRDLFCETSPDSHIGGGGGYRKDETTYKVTSGTNILIVGWKKIK